MSAMSADTLLRQIVSCPELPAARADINHPCHHLICSQDPQQPFQYPEPWSGDLKHALIHFIGSNPSISCKEEYPCAGLDWPEERVVDFFTHRFDGEWVKDGRYGRLKPEHRIQKDNPHAKEPTRYWSSLIHRAEELLQRPVRPGRDYCASEVVRCKSKQELGVGAAFDRCVERHLTPVLRASGAAVVVVLGSYAARAVRPLLGIPAGDNRPGPFRNSAFEADFIFLPHPASFKSKKTLASALDAAALEALRTKLR